MSRFQKLSHTIWHCQYHIVWVPKYRVLHGEVAREVENLIRAFSHQLKCEIIALNVQIDHVEGGRHCILFKRLGKPAPLG